MPHPEEERLAGELSPALAPLNLVVEGVKPVAAGARRTLTVVVDLSDDTSTEAVSMEQIAQATRALDGTLDELEVFGGKPFTLEVSSPGATRELTERRHFTRVVGRRLSLKTNDGRKLVARLRSVGEGNDDGFEVQVHDEKRDEVLTLAKADIASARVDLEFK